MSKLGIPKMFIHNKLSCVHLHLSVFTPRGRVAGIQGELDQELDRTPKHRGGKLDTFSGSFKFNYIIN